MKSLPIGWDADHQGTGQPNTHDYDDGGGMQKHKQGKGQRDVSYITGKPGGLPKGGNNEAETQVNAIEHSDRTRPEEEPRKAAVEGVKGTQRRRKSHQR